VADAGVDADGSTMANTASDRTMANFFMATPEYATFRSATVCSIQKSSMQAGIERGSPGSGVRAWRLGHDCAVRLIRT
jgi:uncharacterized protein with NRDE domain